MGSSSSKGSAKGKSVVAAKLSTAEKTGVLNLADQDLKASSTVWDKLTTQGLVIKLRTLDISGNILKSLPAEVHAMTQLKVLHASHCNIQRSYDMTVLQRLVTLNLDNNDLESVCLAQLPVTLQRLNLCNNHFVTIPTGGLNGLVHLTELNLSGNRLNSTDGIGALIALVDLNVDNNNLTEVSEDLVLCVKLKHLSLRNNKISAKGNEGQQSIPEQVFIETLLDNIDLSGNAMLSKAMVWNFEGIDTFLERRKVSKTKNLLSGAADLDEDVFGNLL